jgi:hypothetical protein
VLTAIIEAAAARAANDLWHGARTAETPDFRKKRQDGGRIVIHRDLDWKR